jgi:hypothetical protein
MKVSNISNICIYLLILILFLSPLYGEEFLNFDSKNMVRFDEGTVLYSIYTQKKGVSNIITKDDIIGIINNQIPVVIDERIYKILDNKKRIILGFENRKDRFDELFLKDYGRGLRDYDYKNLVNTGEIIVVGVSGKIDGDLLPAAASILAYSISKECNGTIFDLSTLECFNNSTFIKLRMGRELGKLRSNIISRVCKPRGGIYRLVTRGMRKYGLPDISFEGLKREYLEMAHLILIGSAGKLYDYYYGGERFKSGEIELTGEYIKRMLKPGERYSVKIKEDGSLKLKFIRGEKGEYDDLNRIVELRLPNGENPMEVAKNTIFDYHKKPIFDYISEEEIDMIAKRAKKYIPRLLEEFRKGRRGEEFFCLMRPVNLPMDADSLIWVKLSGETSRGNLTGVVIPKQKAKSLRPGDILEFSPFTIYDWIYMKNGRTIGGDYFRRYIDYKKSLEVK